MQTVSSLNEIKKWLNGLIKKDQLTLKCPSKDNRADTYLLVPPAVHVGFVPPNSIMDQNPKIRIPCLVVGTPETEGDRDDTTMNMQITAAVYDPGSQTTEADSQLQLLPNFDGYITLLNLLDRVKEWIQREDGISDRFQLESSIKLKTYEEQPWPYWYGYLLFTVSEEAGPVTRYANVLE